MNFITEFQEVPRHIKKSWRTFLHRFRTNPRLAIDLYNLGKTYNVRPSEILNSSVADLNIDRAITFIGQREEDRQAKKHQKELEKQNQFRG